MGRTGALAAGGEEDGVDNTDVDSSRLYTQPEEVYYAYEQLSSVKVEYNKNTQAEYNKKPKLKITRS